MEMTSKKSADKRTAKRPGKEPAANPNALRATDTSGRSREADMAEIAYDPAVRSLTGVRTFIKSTLEEQLRTESLDALNAQVKAVQGENLDITEKTLVAQANTLDAIFNELARRAALNMGEYLETVDR